MVPSLEEEGSGSLKRAREAVVVAVAVAGLALGPGLVTGPGDLETRIAPGPDPGLEPGGPGAAAAPEDDAKFLGSQEKHDVTWRLGFFFLSPTIR